MPVRLRQLTACECRRLASYVERDPGHGRAPAAVWRARLEDKRELAALVTRWSRFGRVSARASLGQERFRVGQVMAALAAAPAAAGERERILRLVAGREHLPKTILLTRAADGWAICAGNRTAVAAHEYHRERDHLALAVLILGPDQDPA